MKKQFILLISIISLLVITIGASYAFFWTTSTPGSLEADGAARLLANIDFVDGQSVVTPEGGIYPGWIGVQKFHVNKPDGFNSGTGTFEIVMENDVDPAYGDWVTYELYITTDSGKTITRVEGGLDSNETNPNEVFLTDSLNAVGFSIPGDASKKGVINSNSSTISLDKQSFDLATWVDTTYYLVYRFNNADENQNGVMGKSFNTVIKAEIVSSDNSSNDNTVIGEANIPVLDSKMVPVVISDDGVVTIADTSQEWYNYTNSKWANAVIVEESFITLDSGTVIPMESIEQMYVWIPRYEYKKSSITASDEAIEVNFIPNGKVNSDIENDIIVHPAFTFDGVELDGIWVGKFEMGFEFGESETTTNVEFIIRPSVISVSNLNVSNLFDNINNTTSLYSMDVSTDVHMIKNSEWGAVAYLSQSQYGICEDNETCSVKIENNNYYNASNFDNITGCGGNDTPQAVSVYNLSICPVENRWETESGIKSSTTHNVTGIYDMAGGRVEYVMGNMQNSSGNFNASSSGFSTAPDAKYYDSYSYQTSKSDYINGMYGDATIELNPGGDSTPSDNLMSNWDDNDATFGYSNLAWFTRGDHGLDGTNAGIWAFSAHYGNAYSYGSTRAVISIVK